MTYIGLKPIYITKYAIQNPALTLPPATVHQTAK